MASRAPVRITSGRRQHDREFEIRGALVLSGQHAVEAARRLVSCFHRRRADDQTFTGHFFDGKAVEPNNGKSSSSPRRHREVKLDADRTNFF
jgi:hypothetical protein